MKIENINSFINVISFVLSSGDEYTVEGLGLYMSGIV
jgi:hypothetical protein